jgi:nucleoside ABC transporter membrane protein
MRLRNLIKYLIYAASLIFFLAALYIAGISPIALIQAALLAMTPLALAASGESLNERAGMVNIGIEGYSPYQPWLVYIWQRYSAMAS